MMRFGLCANIESSALVSQAGFDYIELPLAPSLTPESADTENARRIGEELRSNAIGAEAFNILLSSDVFCVGPNADLVRLSRYFDSAFKRVSTLGGKVVVFGSGGQRRIPDGWRPDAARDQFLAALRLAADHALENGVTVAIEPLNRTETNLVNSVAEALAIAREIDHPALLVLSDLYHVQVEAQAFSETTDAGPFLAHVHVAGAGRRAPKTADLPTLIDYLRAVNAAGYDQRISIECRWDDLAGEIDEALDVLKTAWATAAHQS